MTALSPWSPPFAGLISENITDNTKLILQSSSSPWLKTYLPSVNVKLFATSTPTPNDEFLLQNISTSSLLWTSIPSTSTDSPIIPLLERPETFLAPLVFLMIFILGVFGNGILISIFIKHQVVRNGPNTYIFSLALADLLVIISCVPFTSTVYTFHSWPYGLLICKVSEFSKDVSIGVSVFTLTALSADRFFAIVDPLKKLHSSIGSRRATKFTLSITLFIWIFSIICAAPAAVFSYIRSIPNDTMVMLNVCYPYPNLSWIPNYAQVMVITKFLLYYLIPLSIISIFYLLMARHLIHSTRNVPGEAQGQYRQIKARRKVAITVLAFVIIFAICFLPQQVFMLWFYNNPNYEEDYNIFWHILRLLGFFLSFSNSCINPIALYFVSGTFRNYFNDYLSFCGDHRVSQFQFTSTLDCSRRGTRRENRWAEAVIAHATISNNTRTQIMPSYVLGDVSSENVTSGNIGFKKVNKTEWVSTSALSFPVQMGFLQRNNENPISTSLNSEEIGRQSV